MRGIRGWALGAGAFALVALTAAADGTPRQPQGGAKRFDPARLLEQFDTNKDGRLDRSEVPERMSQRFDQMDADRDGKLSKEELEKFARGEPKRRGRPGEVITPAARGERLPDRLKVGDRAPDFALPFLGGKGKVTLSDFKGKRPVVLIFASYT